MGTEAFDKYEKDIVGLVSNECLKAFGYSDLRKHRSLLSPTDSPKVQKGKSPQVTNVHSTCKSKLNKYLLFSGKTKEQKREET